MSRNTEFDSTPYRVEVETASEGQYTTYRLVRSWNDDQRQRIAETAEAGLIQKLNISPSEELSPTEREYTASLRAVDSAYFYASVPSS